MSGSSSLQDDRSVDRTVTSLPGILPRRLDHPLSFVVLDANHKGVNQRMNDIDQAVLSLTNETMRANSRGSERGADDRKDKKGGGKSHG